jgi:3-phenylpropionate/trans-cinnamate dioxygenase ferredoxin reductase component
VNLSPQHIVIVGGGHGGGSAAAFLRQYGWQGPITLIGDEPEAPYHRPPLSKAWLTGGADASTLALRQPDYYRHQSIALRLSNRVTAIERGARRVVLENGETLEYDHLILALGSRPRQLNLPGVGLAGVLELRSAADANALKAAIGPGRRLAIIGAGYIGLEVAASARMLGAEVVVIEREARVLARVSCVALSQFFEDFHRHQGVEFELNAQVSAFLDGGNRIGGVQLADGRVIACDSALVGVGGIANTELARDAGLDCSDGIIVDQAAHTSDPTISAIGDCTNRALSHYHRRGRLESVPNALEQARQVAAALCGRAPPTPEVPWFWSDQYDLKLQIAGLPFDATEIIMRGDPATAQFALFHMTADGVIQAVEAVNAGPEFMAGKLLIGQGRRVDRAKLRDPAVSMKEI